MDDRLSFRAFGAGLLVFLIVWLGASMAILSTSQVSGGTTTQNGVWLVIQVMPYLAPLASGFAAARLAQEFRVAHGVVASLVGSSLIIVALLTSLPADSTIYIAAFGYPLAGWFGSILGSYTGKQARA